jgi:hypothetical protein
MTDAMDRRASGKPKYSKKEKTKYAREKHLEALHDPPKKPLAAELTNPELLPKKPPGMSDNSPRTIRPKNDD